MIFESFVPYNCTPILYTPRDQNNFIQRSWSGMGTILHEFTTRGLFNVLRLDVYDKKNHDVKYPGCEEKLYNSGITVGKI